MDAPQTENPPRIWNSLFSASEGCDPILSTMKDVADFDKLITDKIANDGFAFVNENAKTNTNVIPRGAAIGKRFEAETGVAQSFSKLKGRFIAAADIGDVAVKCCKVGLRCWTKD